MVWDHLISGHGYIHVTGSSYHCQYQVERALTVQESRQNNDYAWVEHSVTLSFNSMC